MLSSPHVKIRKVSELLGKFSSSFIAYPLVKMYYSSLEINKTNALKIMGSFAPILRPNPSIVLNTDSNSRYI